MTDCAVDYVCRTEVNSSSTQYSEPDCAMDLFRVIAHRNIGVTPQALRARKMP
jgi:hypothetical protein